MRSARSESGAFRRRRRSQTQKATKRTFIGTTRGLHLLDPDDGSVGVRPDPSVGEREVTALASSESGLWVVLDGHRLALREADGAWTDVAVSDPYEATSVLAGSRGLFVGTEEAHLLRLVEGRLTIVEAFEHVEGRDGWYTPWGGPPAVRSLTEDLSGRVHVNVHVGGIPRSTGDGARWEPTIDVDADVHEVIAHPEEPDVVLAACALGLAVSRDGGASWEIRANGMHARYSRAVAVAGDVILMSASQGPRGGHAALYSTSLAGASLEKVRGGLPEWFDGNIDTARLAASGDEVVFATEGGTLFGSVDAGASWWARARELPTITTIALAPRT